jgi:hypothetical protein
LTGAESTLWAIVQWGVLNRASSEWPAARRITDRLRTFRDSEERFLGQDFALTAAASCTISGIITLDGSGLAGVYVSASGTRWFGDTTTGSDGRYNISTFADEYIVTPELFGYEFSPATRSVSLHANTSGVDFTAAVVHMYNVSGTLTFEGSGLADAWLELFNEGGASVTGAMTGPSGNFNFTNVPEGAYTITGNLCGYSIMPLPVTVLGGDMTGLLVSAAAAPNYTVSGIVTLDGVGLPNVSVGLHKSDGSGRGVTTQGDGSYLIDCLAPATYTFSFTFYAGETQYSFSPPSGTQVVLTESNPSVTQNFAATPL